MDFRYKVQCTIINFLDNKCFIAIRARAKLQELIMLRGSCGNTTENNFFDFLM